MRGGDRKAGAAASPATQHIQRAQRYTVLADVLFRLAHEESWRSGRVENMSSSGLLLWTPAPLGIGDVLEVDVPLTSAELDLRSRLLCRCTVVRTDNREGSFGAGAQLTAYAVGPGQITHRPASDFLG